SHVVLAVGERADVPERAAAHVEQRHEGEGHGLGGSVVLQCGHLELHLPHPFQVNIIRPKLGATASSMSSTPRTTSTRDHLRCSQMAPKVVKNSPARNTP